MAEYRKAFHFDLDMKALSKHHVSTDAWTKIRRFMEDNGFKHIQYSGYESRDEIPYRDAMLVLEKLQDSFPWFVKCAKDAKLTNIGEGYDVLEHLREYTKDKDKAKNPKPKENLVSPSLKSKVSEAREASRALEGRNPSERGHDRER